MNRKNINWFEAQSKYSEADYAVSSDYVSNNDCIICHWNKWGSNDVHVCKAFPEGIPPPIWVGSIKHYDNYPGDGGYHFAIAENVPWATEDDKRNYPIRDPEFE